MNQPEVSPVILELAAYIAAAGQRALPPAVQAKTKHHVLDTIAAMVSGSKLLPGRRAIAYAKSRGGVQEALVIGSKLLAPVELAAMANAMEAHADETDDSHAPSVTHPGAGIVPAALAMGERYSRNGTAFLRAVALGYDVGTRFNMSLQVSAWAAEGHGTHTFGPSFGCGAAAALLARLDATQARYVLSYVGQQASGVGAWVGDREHVEKAFDFGGMPARNGVLAAAFVKAGFTATENLFAGQRNFYMAYSTPARQANIDELVRGLGTDYEIMRTNIKRWCVGSPIQAPLDSLYALIQEHKIKPAQVERVLVRVSPGSANTVNNRTMPDINMQQMCAVMLVDGFVSFEAAHDEARMTERRTRDMRARVELVGDAAFERQYPGRQGEVEVTLKDGTKLFHHTTAVRGTAENMMTTAEVDEKCYDLLAPVLGKRRARTLCDTVWDLESVKDMKALRPLLTA